MRTGVIARKEGMTRIFDAEGRQIPVTVLKMDDCQVTAVRTRQKKMATPPFRLARAKRSFPHVQGDARGHFARPRLSRRKKSPNSVSRMPTTMPDVGAEIIASHHFVPGQFVDVTGISTGKGFAGAMKRWNFGGLRATHGVSVSHRSHGSTGNRQDPG
jgi:large subunit ribosomal protein L3